MLVAKHFPTLSERARAYPGRAVVPSELGAVTVKLVAEGAAFRGFSYFRRLRTATDRVRVLQSGPKGATA